MVGLAFDIIAMSVAVAAASGAAVCIYVAYSVAKGKWD
jgi:hypothetical protein